MKNIFAASLLILIFCLTAVSILADTPPFPMPLAQRVNAATHIVVGKAKKVTAVRIIDEKTEKVKKVRPEPLQSGGSGVFFEIEVEIQEVLYPALWKPAKTVVVHYYGGRFSIKKVRENLTQNNYIYLLTVSSSNKEAFFRASYGWDLVEEIKKKEEIKAVLEKRVINTIPTIPGDWQKINICQLNFFAPKNLKNQYLKGIDSCAALFKSKEIEIHIDYGRFSGAYPIMKS